MKAKKNKNFVDKISGSAIIESEEGISVRSAGELPEVFVCGDNDTARLMAAACMDAGLRIPEDIGVTGFDGVSTQVEPFPFLELTTLRQLLSEEGGTAVKRLIRKIERPKASVETVLFEAELVSGATTRPFLHSGNQSVSFKTDLS